jgi:hypothetical protein
MQEYRSRSHVIVEILGDVVRKPRTLMCHAVTGTETKRIEYASFFKVPLDYFRNNFLE